MKYFLSIIAFLMINVTYAQDSWTVTHNGRKIFSARAENQVDNVVILSNSDFKKKDALRIGYVDSPGKTDWERFIIVVDPSEKELYRVKSSSLTLQNSRLQTLLKSGKTLRIFTWALPKDPALRARVRVRRVLICTIKQAAL